MQWGLSGAFLAAQTALPVLVSRPELTFLGIGYMMGTV